jgi:hypothetical protein
LRIFVDVMKVHRVGWRAMSDYPSYYAYPSTPPVVRAMPRPPRLHWGWVLALQLLTRGFFELAWLIVQANWVRRVRGKSRAFPFSIALACLLPLMILYVVFMAALMRLLGASFETWAGIIVGLWVISFVVLRLVTVFTLRSELQEEPIGIPLGGGMTFFFGTIYFQYHLRDWDGSLEPNGVLGLSGATAPIMASDAPQPPSL